MILDSSAILAVLFREPCSDRLKVALANASSLSIGAPTLAEAKIVVGRRAGFLPGIVAKLADDALLCGGDDFRRTDLMLVSY